MGATHRPVPTIRDRFLTLQDRLRASQGRLEAPFILVPGAGQSRLRVRSLSNACPSPESPYPAWRVQALSRIINAGSYAVRPPSSSEGSSSSRATTPPAFRRLKHRSAPPADSRDAGRARDDGRGWTLAPDPDSSPGAASLLARVGPTTPKHPQGLPLALCGLDRL